MGLGSGIRDPRSGKNLFRIPGYKRHWIPDPGSKRHWIPDPDPQHCGFSHLTVERTERMLAKYNFSTKIFLKKINFNHQVYFYNFEAFKFHHKKIRKIDFLCILKVTDDLGTDPDPDPFVTGSGWIGSEDPDTHTDPYQNVTDPEHWFLRLHILVFFIWVPTFGKVEIFLLDRMLQQYLVNK
jgi:hypothetical protein